MGAASVKFQKSLKKIFDIPIFVDEMKVKTAVWDLKNKVPGPDGFPAEFYKTSWNDISDVVFETYIEASKSGKLILRSE